MKPIYLLILSLLPAAGLQAQQGSKDRNYRTETVVRQAGITDARKADSLSITECMRKFSYYDGFGYPPAGSIGRSSQRDERPRTAQIL